MKTIILNTVYNVQDNFYIVNGNFPDYLLGLQDFDGILTLRLDNYSNQGLHGYPESPLRCPY